MACVEAAIACWRSRGWEQDSGERHGLWAIAQRTDAHMAAVGGNSAVYFVTSMISLLGHSAIVQPNLQPLQNMAFLNRFSSSHKFTTSTWGNNSWPSITTV